MAGKHPSEWYTRRLIAKYGPTDRMLYDVLMAVETFGRDDSRVVYASQPEIATRARIGKARTVKAAIRRLEADGWLIVVRPLVYVKGTATGYLVDREPLVAAACEALGVPDEPTAARGPSGAPYDETLGDPQGPPNSEIGDPQGTFRGPSGAPPGQGDIREGAGGVAAAARTAPAAVAGPTAPPLPEADDNGKPLPPAAPVQTCPDHDSWKGDHLCRKCMADRKAAEAHTAAVDRYRADLATWEASTCHHGNHGTCTDCEAEAEAKATAAREAAEAEAAAAAWVASLPRCDHGVHGGDAPADLHGNTHGRCPECERAMYADHRREDRCDKYPTCHLLPDHVAYRAHLNGRYPAIGATG